MKNLIICDLKWCLFVWLLLWAQLPYSWRINNRIASWFDNICGEILNRMRDSSGIFNGGFSLLPSLEWKFVTSMWLTLFNEQRRGFWTLVTLIDSSLSEKFLWVTQDSHVLLIFYKNFYFFHYVQFAHVLPELRRYMLQFSGITWGLL
jgi:hypothetical protein